MKRYTFALAALLVCTVQAQQTQRVTVGDNMNYGLTYSLPATAIQVSVQARCTQTIAGPFAVYAEKFLGLKDVPMQDATVWEVEHISLLPVAVADSTRTYHVTFSEKGALPTFYLSDHNTLLAINHEPDVQPVQDLQPVVPVQKLTFKSTDVMTSDMLRAGSKAKQAELCAEEIFSIRESRSELIRGEADNTPNDGKQLQLMLDNLSAQEAALMSLFVGTTSQSSQSRTFAYQPTQEVEREVLFRFSRELGFVGADDLAGAPYYAALTITEDNRMAPLDPKAQKKVERGIAFCVPGKAQIRLFSAAGTLAEGEMRMAQFGHVEQLPQQQFIDRKRPTAATFHPTTGALHLFDQVNP